MTENTVNINMGFSEKEERHACTAVTIGDWIVFKCEKCPDYERKINWKTGQVTVKNGSRYINHFGTHFPVRANLASFIQN